jgi:hypothetical protein
MKTHHAGRAATSLPEKFTPPAGLSPELAGSLAELTALRTQNLSDSEQHARLWSVLSNLAQVVADTATGDVLPLASFRPGYWRVTSCTSVSAWWERWRGGGPAPGWPDVSVKSVPEHPEDHRRKKSRHPACFLNGGNSPPGKPGTSKNCTGELYEF